MVSSLITFHDDTGLCFQIVCFVLLVFNLDSGHWYWSEDNCWSGWILNSLNNTSLFCSSSSSISLHLPKNNKEENTHVHSFFMCTICLPSKTIKENNHSITFHEHENLAINKHNILWLWLSEVRSLSSPLIPSACTYVSCFVFRLIPAGAKHCYIEYMYFIYIVIIRTYTRRLSRKIILMIHNNNSR